MELPEIVNRYIESFNRHDLDDRLTILDQPGFMSRPPTSVLMDLSAGYASQQIKVEVWSQPDTLGVLQQLGVVPVPGQASK